jgi:TonB-linked SusC/RagA family outer membrane protein
MNKTLSTLICQGLWPLTMSRFAKPALAILLAVYSLQLQASEERSDLQETTVSGKVTDETGSPMPGVNVILKGTTTGVSTDANGTFKMAVQDNSSVLLISFIGYKAEEILVGSQTTINVSLSLDIETLSEIVVVGYGEQKKVNVTGAVAVLGGSELMKAPVANLSNGLAGRIPGIITTQRSGEPGSDGANILIRGIATTGDTAPVFVIDGIFRTDRDFTQLDPNTIESVNILKDAGAAVFGVRAGNGVILVTTKRGTASGKTSLSYSYNLGFQSPAKLPKYLGSPDYAILRNEAAVNAGEPTLFTQAQIDDYRSGALPNTDWYATVLNKYGAQAQHNLSLRGGTEAIRYFVSLGYLDQDGLYSSNNFKRYNVLSNIDVQATKTTKITLDLIARLENRTQPGISTDNLYFALLRNIPTLPATRNINGVDEFANITPYPNPLASISNQSGYNNLDQNSFLSRFSITQDLPFVPGLSAKAIIAFDKGYSVTKNWSTSPTLYNADGTFTPFSPPTISESLGQGQSMTSEFHLNYKRSFGIHNFSGLLLYTQTRSGGNSFAGSATKIASNAIDQGFFSVQANQQYTGRAENSGRRGLVGRINYDMNSKYLFEYSYRYDGTEQFPANNRFGYFQGIAAGWVLSSENFLKNSRIVNFLKLRTSYGSLGNDRLGTNTFLFLSSFDGYQPAAGANGQVDLGNYAFNGAGVSGLQPGRLANPNVVWETVKKFDIGLESELFNGRLSLDLDYFSDRRTDVLGQRNLAVPATFGAVLPVENLGIIDNEGIEVGLSTKGKIGRVNYKFGGNLTYTQNKLVFLDESPSQTPELRQTGRSLYQFFGYEAMGIFKDQAEIDAAPSQKALGGTQGGKVFPGDIRYKDQNNDGVVDGKDRGLIGRSNVPQIIYGITGELSFMGIDFSFLIQGAGRVNQYLDQAAIGAFQNGGKVAEVWLDRWTPEHTDAKYPRILVNPGQNASQLSSFWLQDASYIRLKNVTLSYALPKIWSDKINTSEIRFYASGQNLLTIADMFGDPENSNPNGRYYPQLKVINFGVNVKF